MTLDSRDMYFSSMELELALYGGIKNLAPGMHIDVVREEWDQICNRKDQLIRWERLDYATKNGWKPFLWDKYLVPHDFKYVSEQGSYILDDR